MRKNTHGLVLVSGDSSLLFVSSNEEVTITETNIQGIPVVVEIYSFITSIDMTKIFKISLK